MGLATGRGWGRCPQGGGALAWEGRWAGRVCCMTTAQSRLARRREMALRAREQGGLLTTRQLALAGVTYAALDAETSAGRWAEVAPGVVQLMPDEEMSARWRAVLTVAPRTDPSERPRAALGGVTALQFRGLRGIDDAGTMHVVAPKSSRPLARLAGVRVHETRRWRDADVVRAPIPHARPAVAVIQAAFWARTDREAALLVCAPLQQRITSVDDVSVALRRVRRDRRRHLVGDMLTEFTGGVHSLNELDFARMCRSAGLPEPDRQVPCRHAGGSYYLDARWTRWGVVAEIDGIGHLELDRWLSDSLRHNHLATTGDAVLRLPSVGLRIDPGPYLTTIRRALLTRGWTP